MYYEDAHGTLNMELFNESIRQYNELTSIRIYPVNDSIKESHNYIRIINGAGCFADVGMVDRSEYNNYNGQIVSLGNGCDGSIANIMHTLGHALGFFHTHNRIDRDRYIDIEYQNIIDDDIDLFSIVDFPVCGEYSCDSMMHYRDDSYAKCNDCITIKPKNPSCIIQRNETYPLSKNDIYCLCELYIPNVNGQPSTFCNTLSPTNNPTNTPTIIPTKMPTISPTIEPTITPTITPTHTPTEVPTNIPTLNPSQLNRVIIGCEETVTGTLINTDGVSYNFIVPDNSYAVAFQTCDSPTLNGIEIKVTSPDLRNVYPGDDYSHVWCQSHPERMTFVLWESNPNHNWTWTVGSTYTVTIHGILGGGDYRIHMWCYKNEAMTNEVNNNRNNNNNNNNNANEYDSVKTGIVVTVIILVITSIIVGLYLVAKCIIKMQSKKIESTMDIINNSIHQNAKNDENPDGNPDGNDDENPQVNPDINHDENDHKSHDGQETEITE